MSTIYEPKSQPQPEPARKIKLPRAPKQTSRPKLPRLSRKTTTIIIAGIVLLLLVVLGLVQLRHSRYSPPPQAKSQESTTALVLSGKVFLNQDDVLKSRPVTLGLVMPKSWHATWRNGAKDLVSPSDYGIGTISFKVDPADPSTAGEVVVENVGPWIASTQPVSTPSYRGLQTKAAKSNLLTYLESLRRSHELDRVDKNIPKMNDETGPRTYVSIVHSADSKLAGVVYVTSVVDQSATKRVVAEMGGLVDRESVLLRLTILASSDNEAKIAGVARELLQSFTLDTANRTPQAPALSN